MKLRLFSTVLSGEQRACLDTGHYFLATTPGPLLSSGEEVDYPGQARPERGRHGDHHEAGGRTDLLVWAVDYDTGEPLDATAVGVTP